MVVASFIGDVHRFYALPLTLIILLDKLNSICSSDNMSRPKIILYLWLMLESSTCKFYVIIIVAFKWGIIIYTFLWCFVWNLPP